MISPDQYGALRRRAGLLDRSTRGRLRLTGRDRRAYLQGILTNDIEALTAGTGCYAAYLTPQGRMIADLRVFELGDAILVDVEPGLAEPLREKWDMFIFSEDVQVADESSSTVQLGVYGPRAPGVLAQAFASNHAGGESAPAAAQLDAMPLHGSGRWDVEGGPAHVLRSDAIGVMGFDVVLPVAPGAALREQILRSGATEVDAAAADAVRVEAGRPVFGIDMTIDTIPLEAGIEDRAISLTKGCYVGQEIIIRVLHRGHGRVAKRLVGLSFEVGSPVPSAGETLFAGGREIGAVTSAVLSPALGRAVALGYVQRDFLEPGTAVTVGENKTAARVTALPFVG